jgi:hypothetical protein
MKTTPYPPPLLKMPVLLLLLSMVLASSCKLLEPKDPQETALLEPELLQWVQEVKFIKRTDAFYARLDSLSTLPQLTGGNLASELKLLRSDLNEIRRDRDGLINAENLMRKTICPACGSVLPPKPPPPPPPIKDWDRVKIPLPNGVVVFLRPGTSVISIMQGNMVLQPEITTVEGGFQRAVFNISSLNEGPAVMQIGVVGREPANVPLNMTR